jgi:O-antigen/teichoic acid export membrane protein
MASLTEQVFESSAWVGALRIAQKSMSLIRDVILARLLFPEDFGLFGIATLMLLAFEVLTRTGFDDAIIYIREQIESYLHTSYWIQVLRGLLIGGIVYLGAPLVASFFNEPSVVPIVRVLALVQIVRGFRSIGVVLLRRDLNFRDESIFNAAGVVTNFMVTVALAYLWRDVWALVWGSVAAEVVLLFTSFAVHPYRPKLSFSVERSKELFQFGIWLLGAGIVSYIALQADNIVAGKWLGAGALGVYQMAYMIANLPTQEFAKQIGKVVQSGYAEVQQDASRLARAYRKTFQAVVTLVLPSVAGLVILADIAIPVVLGEKWTGVVPILPILALGAFFRAAGVVGGSLFKATGNTSFVFRVEALRALALLGGLSLCVVLDGGLSSIAWAFVGSTLVMFSTEMWILNRHFVTFRKLVCDALPSIGATSVMATGLVIGSSYSSVSWFHFLLLIAGGGIVYFLSLVTFEIKGEIQILRLALRKLSIYE